MATSRTSPSTRRLSDVARYVVAPTGIVATGWPAVEAKCAEFGDTFDEWQRGAGRLILAKRADGSYAATVGGITLSIPRQVAKTFLVGRIIFALCILYPGLRVIWTAHRTRTATNTFRGLVGFSRRKKVAPYMLEPRSTNGEQEIRFRNGSTIMFGAREQGFGRGFDEIDVEVFDEAQILGDKALEDMVAATNQSRHPHGALLLYMGTPPRPSDPGEVFTARRAEALAQLRPETSSAEFDALYIECSADQGADLNDQSQWAKANPSFPHRTPLRSMLRLRKNLRSDDSWRREGLGIWDELVTGTALDVKRWGALADPDAERGRDLVFGIDVAEDRSAWIAVAWRREGDDGEQLMQVQLIDERPLPAHRLVDRCVELDKAWPGSVFVPPRAFEADLEDVGLVVEKCTAADFPGACGDVIDAINAGRLRHGNQPALNDAAKAAETRTAGTAGEIAWQLKDAPDVPPLVAVTRAVHGLSTMPEGVLVW